MRVIPFSHPRQSRAYFSPAFLSPAVKLPYTPKRQNWTTNFKSYFLQEPTDASSADSSGFRISLPLGATRLPRTTTDPTQSLRTSALSTGRGTRSQRQRRNKSTPQSDLKRPRARRRRPPPAPWPGGPASPAARTPRAASPPWAPSSRPASHCDATINATHW